MTNINRRKFINHTVVGVGTILASASLPLLAENISAKYKYPIGFQAFAVRERLMKDFAGTIKHMASMGYQQVEICYPAGYEQYGFGPFPGIKTSDMRRMIEDVGLYCPSSHFLMGDFRDNMDKCIEFAQEMGLKHMVCPGLDTPGTTIDEYKASANEFNAMAEKIKNAGMIAGVHNHGKEFATIDGQLIYDVILESLDPDLVKMQFQTEVITTGYDAAVYFKKYPGRFISAHLSDWTADKKQVPVGKGIMNWKEFFAAAETGGVKNYFVEMSYEHLKGSANYIHKFLG